MKEYVDDEEFFLGFSFLTFLSLSLLRLLPFFPASTVVGLVRIAKRVNLWTCDDVLLEVT